MSGLLVYIHAVRSDSMSLEQLWPLQAAKPSQRECDAETEFEGDIVLDQRSHVRLLKSPLKERVRYEMDATVFEELDPRSALFSRQRLGTLYPS